MNTSIIRGGFRLIPSLFAGGCIGTFVALTIAPEPLWWVGFIGMAIGALCAYCIHEFKTVIVGIQTGWNVALKKAGAFKWHIRWKDVSIIMLSVSVMIVFGISVSIIVILYTKILLFMVTPIKETEQEYLIGQYVIVSFSLIISFLFGSIFMMERIDKGIPYKKDMLFVLKKLNIVMCLTYWPIVGMVKLIRWFVPKVPPLLSVIGTFFVVLFREIHSDLRTLIAVDSAIGVAVGYYLFQSVIAGGVAGVVWGLVNYYLVSVCWLKLIPTKK